MGTTATRDSETALVGLSSRALGPHEFEGFTSGDPLGRYIAIEELGRGGMGRVIRAYDPKLQREVALKEVHEDAMERGEARRLLVEARAMAKLSHPNVVAVYDVEELDSGRLVIAMEFVPGLTLREWIRRDHPTWSEIVARFIEAGHGLAAAHAVGLLHRDFKPSNVLVGKVGGAGEVVKVTDFGVAKIAGLETDSLDPDRPAADEQLTEAGVVMGTLRYMAPEQHQSKPLTPAADQYAFCVALWEALTGAPPFPSRNIAKSKLAGPPEWPTPSTPAPIVAALLRGLAPDPRERWPNMDALLEAIAYDPGVRRRQIAVAALAVVVVAGTASAAAFSTEEDQHCTGSEDALADVWNDDVRQRITTAFIDSGSSIGVDAAARIDAGLQAFATDWVNTHRDACEAATVRAEQSTDVMDLRMACLHRAKVRLAANTAVLQDVDAKLVPRAHALVDALPSLDRCSDIDALLGDVEPPAPEDAPIVDHTMNLLADVGANLRAGRYEKAREHLRQAQLAMEETDYGPLRTQYALWAGDVHAFNGEYDEAEKALRKGLENAAAWNQRQEMLEVAVQLMMVAGTGGKDLDAALRYVDLARGLAHDHPLYLARVVDEHAGILSAQGKADEAEAMYREAITMFRDAEAPETTIARSLGGLSGVLFHSGRYEEAGEAIREAGAVLSEKLGPEHPDVLSARGNVALVLGKQGKYAEAEQELRAVLALREKYFGPDHLEITSTLYNLGTQLRDHERYDEAEAMLQRALKIRREQLEPDDPRIANVHTGLGGMYRMQGDYPRAQEEYQLALDIRRKKFGPEHPQTLDARHSLAVLLRHQGELDAARSELQAVLELQERIRGKDHADVGMARRELAEVALAQSDQALALQHAEAAWAIHGGEETVPVVKAGSAFVLAQCLAAASSDPADRKRSRALAVQARDLYRDAKEGYEDEVSDVSTWMRKNGLN